VHLLFARSSPAPRCPYPRTLHNIFVVRRMGIIDQSIDHIQLLLNVLDANNAIKIDRQFFCQFFFLLNQITCDEMAVLNISFSPPNTISVFLANKDSRRIIPCKQLLQMMFADLLQYFLLSQQFKFKHWIPPIDVKKAIENRRHE
jgi:hypothetical protein